MYNLRSENQIRLKLGLSPKNKILQSVCLLCQHSDSFLLYTLQGKEVENTRQHPETDSWVMEDGLDGQC